MKKEKFFVIMFACVLCFSVFLFGNGEKEAIAADQMRIALVVKNLGNSFFEACRDGGLEAAKEIVRKARSMKPEPTKATVRRLNDLATAAPKTVVTRMERKAYNSKRDLRTLFAEINAVAGVESHRRAGNE